MIDQFWIDRESPLPLHEQCKQLLFTLIEKQHLKPGDSIPTERELGEQFGLSRTTIRQAVGDLVQQGILKKVQGRGTFVTRQAIPLDLHRFTSFTEDMRARGRVPSSSLRFAGLDEADPTVLQILKTSNPVMKIERLRLADNRIMGIHTAFIPKEFQFDPLLFEQNGSLYNILARQFNLKLVAADETLEAIAAIREEAEMLGIVTGMPILRIERVSYDDRGNPREYVVMRYRADEYKYYVHLSRL